MGAEGGLFEPCLHRSDYIGLSSCLHHGAPRLLPGWLSRGWSRGWLQHSDWTLGTTGDRHVTVCIVLIGQTARLMTAVCRVDFCASPCGRILSGRFEWAHCSDEGGGGHAELRWRIELPALHAVYENDKGAIRQRVEVSVAKEEIGLSPNFIGPHSEREQVALDLFDSIVEELSWCARAGRVTTGRSHRLHRRRDPQLP